MLFFNQTFHYFNCVLLSGVQCSCPLWKKREEELNQTSGRGRNDSCITKNVNIIFLWQSKVGEVLLNLAACHRVEFYFGILLESAGVWHIEGNKDSCDSSELLFPSQYFSEVMQCDYVLYLVSSTCVAWLTTENLCILHYIKGNKKLLQQSVGNGCPKILYIVHIVVIAASGTTSCQCSMGHFLNQFSMGSSKILVFVEYKFVCKKTCFEV